MEKEAKNILTNFLQAARFESPQEIPAACCISSVFICSRAEIPFNDYLYKPEVKLKVQCDFQDRFPGMMILPGIYPDFGCGIIEPSAFGCEIVQFENNPLSPKPMCAKFFQAKPEMDMIQKIIDAPLPDPTKDGFLPKVLEQYQYYWEHLDRKYIENYGYLDGFAFTMGPVETAALVMGYENFLLALLDMPETMHKLLAKTTEFILAWLEKQQEINGPLKRIYLFDHSPARVGPDHFKEFVFPYVSAVLDKFPRALKIYHICDKSIAHALGGIADMGIDMLFFAADLQEVKRAAGNRLALAGNLDPIDLIRHGTPEMIIKEGKERIKQAGGEKGGFILAPGGAFTDGTPDENIQAIIDAARS